MIYDTLFVILTDKLSELINKGEITKNYYNPGNLFSKVHIILTNDDRPDVNILKVTVGSAELYIHNIKSGKKLFLYSLFWRKFLLRIWVKPILKLAELYKPQLVRCHGASINTFIASEIKNKLKIPYIVSLHTNYDEDKRMREKKIKDKIINFFHQRIELYGLKNADLIMPVYKPIIPYLKRLKLKNYQVLYNVINPNNIMKKKNYKIQKKLKMISVGRQFKEKNPINILKAIKLIDNIELSLVGDGFYHDYLVEQSINLGIKNKVKFFKSINNDFLCKSLREYDIFIVHTEYWEISKSVLEALLTGLPIIINRRVGLPVPELSDKLVHYVENTEQSYKDAILLIQKNNEYREKLGKSAKLYSEQIWAPEITEKRFVEVYKKFSLKKIFN